MTAFVKIVDDLSNPVELYERESFLLSVKIQEQFLKNGPLPSVGDYITWNLSTGDGKLSLEVILRKFNYSINTIGFILKPI